MVTVVVSDTYEHIRWGQSTASKTRHWDGHGQRRECYRRRRGIDLTAIRRRQRRQEEEGASKKAPPDRLSLPPRLRDRRLEVAHIQSGT